MNAKSKLTVAVAALGVMGYAVAAEPMKVAALGDVSGKVLVNQGRGFVSAKPGMEIRSGDRIVALDGAAAQVVYGDGCVTDLKENNLLSVDGKCATQPVAPRSENIKLAQAIGTAPAAPAAGGAAAGGGAAAAGGSGGFIPVIGGLFVVAAPFLNDDDSNVNVAPISPQ